jgi:DNA-binding winged helix-turn-helix (wHTH) protein
MQMKTTTATAIAQTTTSETPALRPAKPEFWQPKAFPRLERFNPNSDLDVRRGAQSPDTDQPKASNPVGATTGEVSFGSFRLLPAQFLLLEGDKPVPLGSRALHILIVLLERPGELVTRQELMARVWPNLFVEPSNLSVHVSALRRALRDGRDGNRFIINIPGRGYCFVTPIS